MSYVQEVVRRGEEITIKPVSWTQTMVPYSGLLFQAREFQINNLTLQPQMRTMTHYE